MIYTSKGIVVCKYCGFGIIVEGPRKCCSAGIDYDALKDDRDWEHATRKQLEDTCDAEIAENDKLREALGRIAERCAAPVNEMAQREAVHFAYNTARLAVQPSGERT